MQFLRAFRHAGQSVHSTSSALASGIKALPPPGIALRLVVSFAAVAVLAAAANLIALQGDLIMRTTETRSVPAVRIVEPTTSRSLPGAATPEAVVRERLAVHADELMLALNRYERTLQGRADADPANSAAQLSTLGGELQHAAATFETATAAAGQATPRLKTDLGSYFTAGDALVRNADERRITATSYSAHFEAMNSRIKTALDRAWKIFGRVVARQSLISLSADLDDIRRRSSALASPDGYDQAALTGLEQSETAFAKTLEDNAPSFTRTHGKDWVQQMRDDFAQLLNLRGALLQLDEQRHGEQLDLLRSRSALDQIIRSVGEISSRPQARTPAAAMKYPARASAPGTNAALAGNPAPVSPTEVTTSYRAAPQHRALIGWITTGVLLLLTVISVLTVRSIVLPVRRLLRATTQLASGESPGLLPRGGIRELDTLAVAFNEMTTQLRAAREHTRSYQSQLEFQVEQRTQELQDVANHDSLTRLPNRRHLFTLLDRAIERAQRQNLRVGVFFIDIDNFKNINDGMGHAFGDQLLTAIAHRLDETAREFGFAARLGGDEFTMVYEEAGSSDDIRDAGLTLVQAFSEPLVVEDRDLRVSVSVGASIFPDHEQDGEALLRAADAALFRAKALGRNQLNVFTPELLRLAADRFTTEQGLRRAIERGDFELVFQPEINADTLEASLVEALLRWRLPDGQLASPGEFLAVAEESGLILEISDWVLRASIEAAAHWHHGAWPQARVAINVSPRQLLDQRFVDRVETLLNEFRLPPYCIEIELTETVLQTGAATIATLRGLRELGVAIALDDFGTGYSSLSSLEQLPLTRIKLDRSLIAGIDSNPRSAAIARAIIGLCHGLGLDVTAEGVERQEQFALLAGYKSMCLQGYLLSRPVSRDEVLATLTWVPSLAQELVLMSNESAIMRQAIEGTDDLGELTG